VAGLVVATSVAMVAVVVVVAAAAAEAAAVVVVAAAAGAPGTRKTIQLPHLASRTFVHVHIVAASIPAPVKGRRGGDPRCLYPFHFHFDPTHSGTPEE